MKGTLEKVQLENIDKSSWKTYRFDQIAKSIGERIEPTTTDLEIYVGLEHIDSDSVHIKRFGKREDVTGTKLRCYPGDVIFGRRRAYQRKAAIVEFNGFCSAHSLVLRANSAVIDPKLFPFFLHSDTFMHRAVDISVGSLSPTINWGSLKKEEFLLPPKAQQAQIAELLWAADEVVERENKVLENLEGIIKSKRIGLNEGDLIEYRGNEITTLITKGASPGWQGFEYTSSGILFVTSENVLEDAIELKEKKYLPYEFHKKHKRSQLKKGDVLINIVGASIGRLAVFNEDYENANINQAVCLFRPDLEKALPDYIVNYLLEDSNKSRLLNNQSATARPNLSLQNLSDFLFYLPSLENQRSYLEKFKYIMQSKSDLIRRVNDTKALQKSLINQFF